MGDKPATSRKQKKIAQIVFNPTGKQVIDPCTGVIRTGKYAHFCYEYDELLIDENDAEFSTCLCGK